MYKFHGCTVDVQAAAMIYSTLEKTLCYLCTLNVCYDALYDVGVIQGRFHTGTVNVDAHAFSLSNQYLAFL